jgi:hypothetical protein
LALLDDLWANERSFSFLPALHTHFPSGESGDKQGHQVLALHVRFVPNERGVFARSLTQAPTMIATELPTACDQAATSELVKLVSKQS